MKVLVIGRGSAAKRHTRVLEAMGHLPIQSNPNDPACLYDYAVVANITSFHQESLRQLGLLGFKGKCLVEKPLFMTAGESFKPDFPVYVAYQLRFHPVIQALKKQLEGVKVYSAHIYAGQHIDLWGGTYHGDKSKGGGVLRDYSHEIDLIQWLFGKINLVHATTAINQEMALMLFNVGENEVGISAQFNYFDTRPNREWIINTDKGTLKIDLIDGMIGFPGGWKMFQDAFNKPFKSDSDSLTRYMHEAILSNGKDVCKFDEGLEINRLIDRIEA